MTDQQQLQLQERVARADGWTDVCVITPGLRKHFDGLSIYRVGEIVGSPPGSDGATYKILDCFAPEQSWRMMVELSRIRRNEEICVTIMELYTGETEVSIIDDSGSVSIHVKDPDPAVAVALAYAEMKENQVNPDD